MFRNRMLGGVSHLALFAPETGAGSGGGGAAPGGAAPAAAPGGAAAADPGKAAPAAAAAGATDPAATTLAGGTQDPNPAAAAAAAGTPAFPETWRDMLAGGDKDAAKDLAKYTDPGAMYKSLRELQGKISKGELKAPPQPLPKDATPEQTAAWRTANGLPASIEAMVKDVALPDGVVIGEADKPLVENFAKTMFDAGATQAEMNRAVGWFYTMQGQVETQRAEADTGHKQSSMEALMAEWPGEYKANMNAMNSVLAAMPEELRVSMLTSRTSDGKMLGNTSEFIKWAAGLGRDLNPAATLILPNGANIQSIDTEIAAIEGKMYTKDGKENPEYWRGAGGEAMQARYRELVDARDKMANRGARAA